MELFALCWVCGGIIVALALVVTTLSALVHSEVLWCRTRQQRDYDAEVTLNEALLLLFTVGC